METRLWLLRHPEPDMSVLGLCYGSMDVELSEGGVRQAYAIADMLASEEFTAIYTSPLRRCAEAARILAARRACEARSVDAFRELDFGELEGRSYVDIEREYPELYRVWMGCPTDACFPGGETFRQVQARVREAVSGILARHRGESVALVTHAGVIRILLSDALELAPKDMFRLGQQYGAVNLIRYVGDCPMVDLMNGAARGGAAIRSTGE